MSIRPPAVYTVAQSPPFAPTFDPAPKTYRPACSTNRPLVAPHCCTHMHTIMGTVPSWNANCAPWIPENSV